MTNLRQLAKDQSCVRCGRQDGSVVLCHYTGPRRLAYNGGFGIKVNDICAAHLCGKCHTEMDTLTRDKETKWQHSEEFLHLVMLTVLRLFEQGHITHGP
jgi:hypothetical protein